jgi:pimeloyl-ACP methyl ester carboxylesterase
MHSLWLLLRVRGEKAAQRQRFGTWVTDFRSVAAGSDRVTRAGANAAAAGATVAAVRAPPEAAAPRGPGARARPAHAETTQTVTSAVSHWMSVGAAELHWTEQGAGPPLLVLHGLADSHHSWRAVGADLARRYKVYVLDLQGCGLSGRPDASYGLDAQARLTAAWLDRMELRSVDVLGHSYGGGVALWLLLYRASSVRRLALVAPGGLGSEVTPLLRLAALFGGIELAAEWLMAPITRILVHLCGQGLSAEDQRIVCELNSHPGTARAFVRTLRDVIDWRGQRRHVLHRVHEIAELPSIALFWGENDRVIPLKHGRALCTQLENCSFWQLPGAGHFLHWEASRELAAALLEYLDAPALARAGFGPRRAFVHRRAPDDNYLQGACSR